MCRLKEREGVCSRRGWGGVWGRRSVERQRNKLQTKNARWKRVRFHCCHATHSETAAHFRKLPSLSFCAAFPNRDPLERQLPVEKQRPECVVFHKFHLKGWNEANKSVFFSLRETDLCTLRAQIATVKAVASVQSMFLFLIQPHRATMGFFVFLCFFCFWNISGWLSMHTSFQQRFASCSCSHRYTWEPLPVQVQLSVLLAAEQLYLSGSSSSVLLKGASVALRGKRHTHSFKGCMTWRQFGKSDKIVDMWCYKTHFLVSCLVSVCVAGIYPEKKCNKNKIISVYLKFQRHITKITLCYICKYSVYFSNLLTKKEFTNVQIQIDLHPFLLSNVLAF